MHLSQPYPCFHAGEVPAPINNDDCSQTEIRVKKLNRYPSLNSISSADTINNNEAADAKPSDSKTRIRRSKIALSSMTSSYVKRSSVTNSTLATMPSVKWSHINDSNLANILTLKRAKLESAIISNVVDIRRATIASSTISDALRIKKVTIIHSLVRRVPLLERSTMKNCFVSDCIIYKTDFEGKVLENGIWKGGRLLGRIDQGREVVVKALKESESTTTDRIENDENEGKRMQMQEVDDPLVKEHKGYEEEALPVYKL